MLVCIHTSEQSGYGTAAWQVPTNACVHPTQVTRWERHPPWFSVGKGPLAFPEETMLYWGAPTVTGLAADADTGFVATNWGVLQAHGAKSDWIDPYYVLPNGPGFYATVATPPSPHSIAICPSIMSIDGAGNLWCRSCRTIVIGAPSQHFVLPTRNGLPSIRTDTRFPEIQRWAGRWQAPDAAIAGDPTGPGLWTYGLDTSLLPGLFFVGADDVSLEKARAARPVLPVGTKAPSLNCPLLAVSKEHDVWLAGDALTGSRVFAFDGRALFDITPPADLLRGRRFTQLLAAGGHRLYAATDGVGVLAYNGKTWAAHPINSAIPEKIGTGLKQVNCMAIDRDGNLWIGYGDCVICYSEGK
jgi:hypothetical protein